MGFSDECVEFAGPAWDELVHHKWIEALIDGSLSQERFRYWFASNVSYLNEMPTLRGIMKSPPDHPIREVAMAFAQSKKSAVLAELVDEHGPFLHTRWAARPAREAYNNFVLMVINEGTFAQVCCANYPCLSFAETLGDHVGSNKGVPAEQEDWLRHLAFDSRPLQNALKDVIDTTGANTSPAEQDAMRWTFLRATQHQVRTFDAAWEMSDPWPGESGTLGALTTNPAARQATTGSAA